MLLICKGGVRIRSVQSGTAEISAGTNSVDVIVSEVDLNKAVVRVQSQASAAGTPPLDTVFVAGYLTSGATLRLERHRVAPTITTQVLWEVIELDDAVVQYVTGTIGSGSTTVTVTISPIDHAHAFGITSAISNNNTATSAREYCGHLPTVQIINSTTVQVMRRFLEDDITFHAYIVEVK